MASLEEELDRIEGKVEQLADSALKKGVPYLLSALGKDLGDDLRTIKALTKANLSEFLENRLSDRFAVVLGGQHSNVKAIVRTNSESPVDNGMAPDAAVEASGPRFNYRFWASFSVPLSPGKRRWMDRRTFVFRDLDEEPEGNEVIEIPADLIPAAELQARDAAIRLNIQKWLEMNSLDHRDFLASRPAAVRALSTGSGDTALSVLLAALDHRQLMSVSLPLDVVASLAKRRI